MNGCQMAADEDVVMISHTIIGDSSIKDVPV